MTNRRPYDDDDDDDDDRDASLQVEEVVAGKIRCEDFISDFIPIDKINWAIEQMKAGRG